MSNLGASKEFFSGFLVLRSSASSAVNLFTVEALAYDEVAEMMSGVLRRPIRYRRPSLARFAWHFWRQGHPLSYVAVVSAIYTTTRLGMAERVTTEAADLLGCPPGSMYQFIVDEAAVWQRQETAVAAAAKDLRLETGD